MSRLTLAGVFLVGLYAAVCLPGFMAGRGAFADVADNDGLASGPLTAAALAQTPQVNADAAGAHSGRAGRVIYQAIRALSSRR
jgi:hypothetical protein